VAGERDAALAALRRYDVAPRRVTFAAESFNSIFRVTATSGVYALRVGSAVRIHPDGTSAVEVAWQRRLCQQGVGVPEVVANADGQFATLVQDGSSERVPRECVLSEWVTGRSLRSRTAPSSADIELVE
jgi:Ser/Thr protein kinase RdoA (MazF antagonist)